MITRFNNEGTLILSFFQIMIQLSKLLNQWRVMRIIQRNQILEEWEVHFDCILVIHQLKVIVYIGFMIIFIITNSLFIQLIMWFLWNSHLLHSVTAQTYLYFFRNNMLNSEYTDATKRATKKRSRKSAAENQHSKKTFAGNTRKG